MCGGVVEQVEKAVVQPIGKGLSEVDTTVNREVPGGWILPAAAAVAATTGYVDPSLLGEAAFTGATETGLSTLAGEGVLADTIGTTLLAGAPEASGFVGLDAATAAELGLVGESGLGTAGATGDVLAGLPIVSEGAPIFDYSTEATLTPGGNVVPANTLPSEMAAIDAQIATAGKEAAASLPTKISPMQAIQGIRMASGLLGGGQQQQQAPQMQMGGRMQTPQGAVDYSGIYNLLALQRARNPNSLLG